MKNGTTSKYGLASMKIGQKKSFALELWDRVRLSAHFTGKRYERIYRTEKKGEKIFVIREK